MDRVLVRFRLLFFLPLVLSLGVCPDGFAASKRPLRVLRPDRGRSDGRLRYAQVQPASARARAAITEERLGEMLYQACARGDVHSVSSLISRGAPLNFAPISQDVPRTPLSVAVLHHHPEVVRVLLATPGVQVNQGRIDNGATPLYTSAYEGHVEEIELLTQIEGIDLNSGPAGDSPLLAAVLNGHLGAVTALLHAGADFSLASPQTGVTPLYGAVNHHQDEIVQALLQAGADPNQEAGRGRNALRRAAHLGDLKLVELLLQAGAEVDRPHPEHGATALLWAVRDGHAEVVAALLAAGAQPDVTSSDGSCSLRTAASKGSLDVVRLLVQAGATVDLARRDNGFTALLSAASGGKIDVVAFLLANGADPSHLLKTRESAQDLAQKHGHPTTAMLVQLFSQMTRAESAEELLEIKSEVQIQLTSATSQEARESFSWLKGELKKRLYRAYFERQLGEQLETKRMASRPCMICQQESECSQKQLNGKGPAGCCCFVCSKECGDRWINFSLGHHLGAALQCPGCDGLVLPAYLEQLGRSPEEVEKFLKRQVDSQKSREPGWVFCPTPDCSGGRVVKEGESGFYACPLCEWQGCLRCRADHRGGCRQAREELVPARKMLDFILTQGRLSPPERGHPRDAKDPAYYHGRFRPCYYCGIVTEKEYRVKADGSPAEEMCNAMQCQNPQCLKKWHWNYGDHRKHPNCRGADAVHDFKLDEQRYEPLRAPQL